MLLLLEYLIQVTSTTPAPREASQHDHTHLFVPRASSTDGLMGRS
jgi:hypothetical protein